VEKKRARTQDGVSLLCLGCYGLVNESMDGHGCGGHGGIIAYSGAWGFIMYNLVRLCEINWCMREEGGSL
jgi:hypothetical protein